MNIATYFTFLRLLISPLFLLFYWAPAFFGISSFVLPYLLFALICLNELSDALDGYLARKYNQVTDLGKILDPMADSISRCSIFLSYSVQPVSLPLPLVFIFFYRDSVVSTLRTVCALKGYALAARASGKIKAVVQAVAVLIVTILLIPHSQGLLDDQTLQLLSAAVVGVAALYTIYSGIDYVFANRRHIVSLLRPKMRIVASNLAQN